MHSILVIGAGKIGSTIADMLHETGDYAVTVADSSAAALKRRRHARHQDDPARFRRRGRAAGCPEGPLRRAERRALST